MHKGLTSKEAAELLHKYQLNAITDRGKSNLLKKIFEQISSFLMILLICAALISFFIGEVVDGSLILIIVALNAAFGVFQEFKAEEAVSALQKITVSTTRLVRDGKEQNIDSKFLVPGDIIFIEEGVKLPADAEILETIHLEINEAALTGESIPVTKAKGEEIFMGTIVAKGRGIAKVKATGMSTKFGQIAGKLSSTEEGLTPLQLKLNHLTEIIGLVGIVLSIAVFILSSAQGNGYFPSFLLAISLAVALVPESLPAVMTVILSIGVKHLANRKAIIRKLGSIEALGNVTLIATDKTGTLTTNTMEVKEIWIDAKVQNVEHFEQVIKHKGQSMPSTLHTLLLNGILCSTASLVSVSDGKDDTYEVLGDPTEGSLLKLAKKLHIEPDSVRSSWHLEDEIGFDSIKKRMTVIAKDAETVAFSKGAPESILLISTKILVDGKEIKLSQEKIEELHTVLQQWATQGLRVLAFSYRKCEKDCDFEQENTFIGMVAIHDAPRKEAKEAIAKAFAAGIQVVMITGDNPQTAEAIGTSIGLLHKGEVVLTGDQIESYNDDELMALLPRARVFARVTPFHKSRIVSLYQRLGEIVAVTGDGINDAIALKQADVGIAMGKIGTDVARETADIVITDDNFATIINAVDEGRNIVKRLKSSVKYLLAGNLAEGIALVTGLLLGFPPIFLPIQLLYINLISDGVPALTFAFTPQDERVMREKPKLNMELINSSTIKYIVGVGVIVGLIVVAMFYWKFEVSEDLARTVAFSAMSIVQIYIFIDIWFSHRPKHQSIKPFLSTLFFITVFMPFIAQFIIIKIPFIADLFEVIPVSVNQYFVIVIISAMSLIAIKIVKKIVNED